MGLLDYIRTADPGKVHAVEGRSSQPCFWDRWEDTCQPETDYSGRFLYIGPSSQADVHPQVTVR
ncbi:hypothetical protein Tco_0498433, partial [Tanacetum coccineum]